MISACVEGGQLGGL